MFWRLILSCAGVYAEEAKPFPDAPQTAEVEPTAEQKSAITKWIEQLGDADFQTRVNAESELRKAARTALKQLKQAETNDDLQIRTTAGKIVRDLQTEVWEGYYVYSLENFEDAVANGTRRVRFWFTVTRGEIGTFTANADEQENLGRSTIKGKVDREKGDFSFDKTYSGNEAPNWRYEGKWNAQKQRVEGTYGPGSGAFVLYPRKLSDEEHKKFDDKSTGVVPVLEEIFEGDDF